MRELIESFEISEHEGMFEVLDSIKPYAPLPMSVWQVNGKSNVLFSKGNGIIDDQAKELNKLFTVKEERSRLIEAHSNAASTESTQFFISESGKFFTVKLVCDDSKNGDRIITGFAIEVSDIVRGFLKNDV
jgi:hypothetical protein